ncbi:hypothetical protein [Embleya sp. MST-111070]|uniref:hypothetical protein n=1 Tax=Embleya sp. MST-111070 TaxID=3398231 RepID=UPI003F7321B6
MQFDQFTALLLARNQPRTLDAADLTGAERTLAYGYTLDGYTWHCYLRDGQIHVLVYNEITAALVSHEARPTWNVIDLAPDKRVYPESVDAEFARALLHRGQELPFTRFNEDRYARVASMTFHGAIYDSASGAVVQVGIQP